MKSMKNLISIDLEEWYTSAYLRDYVKRIEPQIHHSIKPVLSLLAKYNTTATFFAVGSVAEKHPDVIEAIQERGHEIANHTYGHTPLFRLDRESFRRELRRANEVLKRIVKERIIGFRAPYFSIDRKRSFGIEVLREENFKYDSSIFPMKTPLYGAPGAPSGPYCPSRKNIYVHDEKESFAEYPMSVYQSRIGNIKIPLCGGFYGRVLPARLMAMLARRNNKKGIPWNFYFHPWETYRETPRLNVSFKNSFITYHGMRNYLSKIEFFLRNFRFVCLRDHYEEHYG